MLPIIYLDMDGVLADIDTGLRKHFNLDHSIADRSSLFKSYLPEYTKAGGFEMQPKLENADKLVNYVLSLRDVGRANVAILTSAGQFYKPTSEVVAQKRRFLEREFPALCDVPFCVTTSGVDKAFLAHEGAFLVDDWHKNVTHFCNAGGAGFVYSSDKCAAAILAIRDFLVCVT